MGTRPRDQKMMELMRILNDIRDMDIDKSVRRDSVVSEFVVIANCSDLSDGPGHFYFLSPEDQPFSMDCFLAEFLHERQLHFMRKTIEGF